MARTRQTYKNNIVILCEGTDTEFNYFNNAKEYVERNAPGRFSSIKIVPVSSEIIKIKNRKKRKERQLKEGHEYHYYCQWEYSEEEYNRYKAMPTRFVRETQLYMERDGYVEGWAVFDRDVHPDHANAFALARSVSNLHIAFSSYCFEEWLLAHFERNPQPYIHSECMINDHHSKECGTNTHPEDCHGTSCLAGILREKGYISTYSKSAKNLFETYTLDRLLLACANAAWLRRLSPGEEPYNCNPYTDVDRLILRLLAKEEVYEWHALNESFACMGTSLCARVEDNSLFLENKGVLSCVINTGYFAFWVDYGRTPHTVQCATNNIQPGTISDGIPIPADCTVLSIREGAKTILINW